MNSNLKGLFFFTGFSKFGRAALTGIIAIALVGNAFLSSRDDARVLSSITEAGTLLSIGLFAWRPPIGAVLLLAGGFAAVHADAEGAHALALAAASGLVVHTCSPVLIGTYAVGALAWLLKASAAGDGVGVGGFIAIVVVGALSSTTGLGFRKVQARARRLVTANMNLVEEATKAVELERVRIADELHNIIAHDITIVVMHARALQLTKDPNRQQDSIRAVVEASTQALTDIRRMLKIHENSDGKRLSMDPVELGPIPEALRQLRADLVAVGIPVQMRIPGEVVVSPAINSTLVHIARECGTNILKHAPNSAHVHIDLFSDGGRVRLEIKNVVSQPSPVSGRYVGGSGIRRMTERVELLGGRFAIETDERSWIVNVHLPAA